MSVTKALFSVVVNSPSVNTFIGTRFRPGVANPKDKYPFADYIVQDDRGEHHSTGKTKARSANVEIAVFAEDHLTAESIANTIRDVLEATSGAVAGVSGFVFRRIFEQGRSDQPDIGQRGQSKGPFAVVVNYRVLYRSNN